MNGRTIVNIALGAILVAILVGLGLGVYNAGIAQGLAEAGRLPEGAQVPGYGYGYGWGHGHGFFGFGLFGLIFPILFILLLFGLFRAAAGGWRRGARGPWGRGGPGGPWGPGGGFDREGWREERERYMADLHRRLHDQESGTAGREGGSAGV